MEIFFLLVVLHHFLEYILFHIAKINPPGHLATASFYIFFKVFKAMHIYQEYYPGLPLYIYFWFNQYYGQECWYFVGTILRITSLKTWQKIISEIWEVLKLLMQFLFQYEAINGFWVCLIWQLVELKKGLNYKCKKDRCDWKGHNPGERYLQLEHSIMQERRSSWLDSFST